MDDFDVIRNFDGSIDPFALGVVGFITLVFALVILGIVVAIIKGLVRWNRNNHAPRLTVPAVLVVKRQERSRSSESTTTWYHITFEIAGHERIEFPVDGHQWGTLVEGDRGRLTYQGTRYQGFDRTPQDR